MLVPGPRKVHGGYHGTSSEDGPGDDRDDPEGTIHAAVVQREYDMGYRAVQMLHDVITRGAEVALAGLPPRSPGAEPPSPRFADTGVMSRRQESLVNTIIELSSPVVPIAPEILVMPVVIRSTLELGFTYALSALSRTGGRVVHGDA
ncbi:hypothetical protein [Sorangium sp. So ce1151]|uniref:hypothetical protein n=1 Tax=Sorangium sp. So ce1151 TaxID=3133332 RepID=UPI003F60E1EC